MNRILRHISIFAAIVAIVACSMVEMPDNLHENKTVEFVVRNTTFSNIDVSVASTKALTGSDLTAVERKIVNAYFLVFGEDGTREEFRTLEVTDNTIPSQTLTHDYDNGPIKVCYLANVAEDVASSYKTWNDILTKPLAITYPEYNEDYFSTTGHVGIPSLDGELCFPMFNFETYPGKTASNGVVEVQLERLFAKVVVNLSTDFETGGGLGGFIGGIFDAPNLTLHSYKVTNLPTNVILNNQEIENSSWVTYDNIQDDKEYFKAPINVDIEDITVNNDFLIETPEELLTLYVPEYYLAPKSTASNNTDQKLKPTMFDESKRPVFITIAGLAHQANFVDVPLEYNIYLGEDAVKDFDLRRNRQYNNNMTVTGTGEAILGSDTRVEATYHNLADPNSTGTDNPANCYIIGRPGRYLIPTYKGCSSEMLGGIDISKTETYSDGKNSITNLDFFTDENGKNWVIFDVNMTITDGAIANLPDIQDGNTVLEFKNSAGNTVWSWHLWFTSGGILGSEWGGISSETYDGTTAVMMTHNIGAADAGSDGLYYLWGDKDPYLTPSGKSAGYYGNVATGSWSGNSKSVTDPCPPGYRVPSNAVWMSESVWKGTTAGADGAQVYSGAGFFYDLNPNIMYPFSSYMNGNTKVTHGYSIWSDELENKDFGGTIYYRERYQLVDGLLWTSAQNECLYYGVKKMQAEALGALYKVPILGTIEIDPTSRYWKYVSSIADKVVEWVIATDKSVYKNPGTSEFVTINNSSGVQVRCVSETSPVK